MPDMIHMTLEYSNAVLVALLPVFSDFARKLELPISTPITCESVGQFAPRRLPGDVGGTLRLTNGWRFDYFRGYVDSFEATKNYLDGQRRQITRFFVASTNLFGKPPEISVKPELESEYRKRVKEGEQIYRRDPPPERLLDP
jgi:hypothetical protein